MLYETLFQPKIFLILFLIGFVCGFLLDFASLMHYFTGKNKAFKEIFASVAIILSFIIFDQTNLLVNYGDLRFFPFLAFWGAFVLQRLTIGKILAKFMEKCYNFLRKLLKTIFEKLKWKKKEKNSSK